MKKFAILSGNKVENIIVADSIEDARAVVPGCVEIDEFQFCGVGAVYDKETNTFANPLAEDTAV